MTAVKMPPLLEHVFSFRFGVVGSVRIDIGTNVGEEVRSVSGFGYACLQALQLTTMVVEDLSMTGEVVLFEGRGGEAGFRIEEPR